MSKKIKKASRKKAKKQAKPGVRSAIVSAGTDSVRGLQQAVSLHQKGELGQAEKLYQAILIDNPRNPEVNHLLGLIFYQTGRNASALENISTAIAVQPDVAQYHSNLGIVQKAMGRINDAMLSYQDAIRLDPDHVDAYYNMGNIFREHGELQRAVDCYSKTIQLKSDHFAALNNLGRVLEELGHLDKAKAAYLVALRLQPDYAEALNNLGNVLSKQGDLHEAISSYRQALGIRPDYAEAMGNLGGAYEQDGDLGAATDVFRKALELKPDYTEAYRMLAGVKHFADFQDPDLKQMEDVYARPDLNGLPRMHLSFALGKAYEDLGDNRKAFGFFDEGNQLNRATYTFSIEKEADRFAAIKNIFTKQLLDAYQGVGCSDNTPIFVLGMPRSGTSLVEQILASHPQVYGAGELKDLADILDEQSFAKGEVFPAWLQGIDPTKFVDMGKEYVERMRRCGGQTQHIVDKMPHNFLYIGMIKMILPEAKIIHCQRDPMDTCWSIFKNYFVGSHPYAYNLDELGEYYLLYQDLMRHWHGILSDCILDVNYEDVVAAQEEETRRLLDFCGLPWHDDCLKFYKTARTVRTASSSQVRKPIYNSSVKKWRCYEEELSQLSLKLSGSASTSV